MRSSIDGRIQTRRWRPEDASRGAIFGRLHDPLGVDAWLIGRIRGQGYSKREAHPVHTDQRYPWQNWFARRNAAACGIVLDAHGKIAWGRSDVDSDPLLVVLTELVSDPYLAGLHEDGVSYIFAGRRELDLGLALEILNREFGIKRLEVNGGGITSGGFLRAGLIDEISLAIFPAVDGGQGVAAVFDAPTAQADTPAPLQSMTLASSAVLACGAVWLRYRVENDKYSGS